MNVASKTKKILAAAMAALMILSFMPMTQENAYAAKAKKPAQVKGLSVEVAEDNQVTVTWKKAKNAKKYSVSVKDGGTGFTAVKSSKKTKLTFKGGNAVKYTVKVQGVNGKKKGKFSKAVSKTTNDLVKAAEERAEQAERDKAAAEAALEEIDDVGRDNLKDGSMHIVYSTTGMLRINDEGTSVTMSEDGETATIVAQTSSSKTWGQITKLAFAKQTATDEEKDAAAADIHFDDDTFYEDASVSRKLTFSIPASKIGKKLPVCRYQYVKDKETNEWSVSWLDFSTQAYMIVLSETERKLYEDLAAAEERAKDAEDELAVIQFEAEWAEAPELTVDSSEEDIAEVEALIDAYDGLTDDQKALVPDDVKAEIEAAKTVIAEIKEAAEKIAAVKQAVKDAEAGGTVTIDEKEFIVVSKESDTAELILKNGIEDVPFDTEGGYDWALSSLRTYLNTDWLEANPTVGALAEETSYTYWIGEYDIDEDDFVYQAKTSTDHVYVPAYDGADHKVQLPQEIEAQLKTGCAFWSSCGGHLKYYDDDDEGWVEEQGAYSIGEAYQVEWDSSATQTMYDGVNYVPIKVNPMFTVSLS